MPSRTVSHRPAQPASHRLAGSIGRYHNAILVVLTVVLIFTAGILVYLLATQTFKPYFNCQYLIDETLHTQNLNTSLCNGAAVNINQYEVVPYVQIIPNVAGFGPIKFGPLSLPVLPAMKPIDGPLEGARQFVAWNIILVFAVLSLGLAWCVIKIKNFVAILLTAAGRKTILINLSVWLLIFAVFCSLFYFWVVAGSR